MLSCFLSVVLLLFFCFLRLMLFLLLGFLCVVARRGRRSSCFTCSLIQGQWLLFPLLLPLSLLLLRLPLLLGLACLSLLLLLLLLEFLTLAVCLLLFFLAKMLTLRLVSRDTIVSFMVAVAGRWGFKVLKQVLLFMDLELAAFLRAMDAFARLLVDNSFLSVRDLVVVGQSLEGHAAKPTDKVQAVLLLAESG